MHPFEYLSVLLSIVLGLGLTQLLTAFGRWLELRGQVKPYAPAALWSAFLLLVYVQTWWAMFGLRRQETWSFLQFATVLAQPILLFLLSALALPGQFSSETDLKAFFHHHRRWFFGIFLCVLVASAMKDIVLAGVLPTPANLAFHTALFLCGVVALAVRRDLAQLLAAVAALLIMLVYIAALFANLA